MIIITHHLYAETSGLPQMCCFTWNHARKNTFAYINKIIRVHRDIMPDILAAHALAGGDTVSSFAGVGKATAFKKLKTSNGVLKLGDLSATKEEITKSCPHFISVLQNHEKQIILVCYGQKYSNVKLQGSGMLRQSHVIFHQP